MTRDYKSARRAKPTPSSARTWVWLLLGLIPGLLIALLIYLGGYSAGARPGGSIASAPAKSAVDTRGVRKTPESKPLPDPPAVLKPRFDFYTILPEMEVAIPEQDVSGAAQQGIPQVERPGTYLLQAGSFRSFEEADRLKASLVLLGIEATIQTVTINNKDTWHRVHIGPYKDLSELNQIRARLKQNHIEAVLLKVKV